MVDQVTAEGQCQKDGGHLAAYVSAAEQAEVEKYYIDKVGRGSGPFLPWKGCGQLAPGRRAIVV
jgi:hypothetical protein